MMLFAAEQRVTRTACHWQGFLLLPIGVGFELRFFQARDPKATPSFQARHKVQEEYRIPVLAGTAK
jgi:hypothetical protein